MRKLTQPQLPFHCQWQDLKDLFRQAGTIIRADVALGQDGRSRGFGTVVFATEADAERAVRMFSGCVSPCYSYFCSDLLARYEYNGRLLKVHYDKFSQPATSSSAASAASAFPSASASFPNSPFAPSFSSSSFLGNGNGMPLDFREQLREREYEYEYDYDTFDVRLDAGCECSSFFSF